MEEPSQVQRGGLSKIFVRILTSDLSIAFRLGNECLRPGNRSSSSLAAPLVGDFSGASSESEDSIFTARLRRSLSRIELTLALASQNPNIFLQGLVPSFYHIHVYICPPLFESTKELSYCIRFGACSIVQTLQPDKHFTHHGWRLLIPTSSTTSAQTNSPDSASGIRILTAIWTWRPWTRRV